MLVQRSPVQRPIPMLSYGPYHGLDLNTAIRNGRKQYLVIPEIFFINGIVCRYGNIPGISGQFLGPRDGTVRREAAEMMIGSIVFEYLAINSFKAGATRFTVETFRRGGLAVIDVSDDGCGMPESFEKRLFRKGATLTTKHFPGHDGTDLYYSRIGMKMLGGKIELVRNVPIGTAAKGSSGVTFRLTLPIDGMKGK
jgi:hypothetical protein